jgi:hypothetical protein
LVTSIANVAKAQFDDYKYIVIPELFDGFDKNNQHQTNSLVKHLFDKNGFNTAYGGNLPADLQQNACLGLYVQLVDRSTMFTTKTTLVLKDCNGSEVFSSLQGRSKEKDYKVSYGNAIRDAFRSFEGIKHSYVEKTPATSEEPVVISFKDDVKKLDQPNRGRQPDPMVEQETSEERQYYRDRRPVPSDFKKAETKEVQKESIDQVATPEEQRYEAITPVESDIQKEEPTVQKTTPPLTMLQDFGVLYAQELPNGFQLVDSTPKIQMKLRKSSSPNVFFAEADDTNGVVFSQAGKWIFEYYYQDQLVSKELNIKF